MNPDTSRALSRPFGPGAHGIAADGRDDRHGLPDFVGTVDWLYAAALAGPETGSSRNNSAGRGHSLRR